MKKILLLILFSSLAFSQVKYAESTAGQFRSPPQRLDFPLSGGLPKEFGQTVVSFSYFEEQENNNIKIQLSRGGTFTISKDDKDILIKQIEKYFDWRNKAIANEVEVEKYMEHEGTIRVKFLSKSTKRHQLVLDFSHRYTNFSSDGDREYYRLYLEYHQALQFKDFLSEDYINSKKVIFD